MSTTATERPRTSRNPLFDDDTSSFATTSTGLEFRPQRTLGVPTQQRPTKEHSHTLVIRTQSDDPRSWGKPYWGVSQQVLVSLGYVLSVEVAFEQLGLPGDAIASESPWPILWTQPHAPYGGRPGVLFLTHQRPKLFEERVVLHTASLPWWKPQIILSRRRGQKRDE